MNARHRRRAIQRVRGRVIASWVMVDATTLPRTWIAIDRSDEEAALARGSSPSLEAIDAPEVITLVLPVDHTLATSWADEDRLDHTLCDD